MLRFRKALKYVGGVVAMTVIALFLTVTPAYASSDDNFLLTQDAHYLNQCGRFWPSAGTFQTTQEGSQYAASMTFQVTQAQKNALKCVDPYLELDFHLFGFTAPANWDGYSVSTDIPGAIHDTAIEDKADDLTPGLTRIWVDSLVPNHVYTATINFSLPTTGNPRISYEWVPSYWATSFQEQGLCNATRYIISDAMCIFGKVRVFLSHAYNNRVSLIFDGYRLWQYGATTPTSSLSSNTATDLPSTTALPPANYRADRTVLHGPDGSLYIMAGGAKFYEGSGSEFTSLGYSTSGMVNLSSNDLASIPNIPKNGTILRSGGGQIYIVAGGAKFYEGSMTEYHNNGYSDSQMVNVPQGSLDSMGSVPSDGTIIRHPDGRLYIMAGGVKFLFGSMTEFTSLGYSSSSITYVSSALDSIPAASAATPSRDGTILRSGGGQIYIVAGGAKFHYGSMDEYYSLGAQNTDWINVPQGPLDSIGDAPGNVPRDKTLLRSGGGQVYVMAGGVRWAFTSMTQYYQLGYTDTQVVRVSQTPLDGISDASSATPPTNETLLQGADSTLWVIKSGVRRSFTDTQQAASLGYSLSNIVRVPDYQLAIITNGGPVS